MREFLKSSGRWLRAGWFWPLVLLALPTCGLVTTGIPGDPPFDPGSMPRTYAVMCDIPTGEPQCTLPSDVGMGMLKTFAAVALVTFQSNNLVIDLSGDAMDACGPLGQKIEFFGPFPDGTQVCFNCGSQVPVPYPDANAVCIQACKELLFGGGSKPSDDVDDFCAAKAHVSTNFTEICYKDACSPGGTPVGFVDPRRSPEVATWVINPLDGTDVLPNSSNSLTRTANTTQPSAFDAGSAAAQIIKSGDGWIEFGAGELGVSHVLGVSACKSPCDPNGDPADNDPSLLDIESALSLDNDNQVFVLEGGGAVKSGPFLPYDTKLRFRLRFVDNHDTTAKISYWWLDGVSENLIFEPSGTPSYPLRIDTSFREKNASLVNVTIVRIIQ